MIGREERKVLLDDGSGPAAVDGVPAILQGQLVFLTVKQISSKKKIKNKEARAVPGLSRG